MESPKPKLIFSGDGEAPTSAICSVCGAVFPTLKENGADANKRLLEDCFQQHVRGEHSDQPA